MMIALNAHFDGMAIVPDEPLDLPAGQRLIVHVSPVTTKRVPPGTLFSWVAENAVDDASLPTDFAEQHDHYIHGTPKRPPGE